ncbi:MAG: TonB-dependent receptor [Burkholderiaceae bacterium]
MHKRICASAALALVLPALANAQAPVAKRDGTAFNPAISLILSGNYKRTQQDPEDYAIAGFPRAADAETAPGSRGLSLDETELGISANIDPYLRGAAFVALEPGGEVSVEEAFIQTTGLGAGLSLKAGRFYSGIGYLNPQHPHVWDFVDNPLAYQAMLGTQYGDDGVQLQWLAPTPFFLRFGGELGRGRSFPGTDTARNGSGMAALYAHIGGDLSAAHSWRAGVSVLRTKAQDQTLIAPDALGNDLDHAFTGTTRVWVADAVWKWTPAGALSGQSFKLQAEYLCSRRTGDFVFDVNGAASADAYRVTQSGWYVQGVYQFAPRWRVGARTERLDAGAPDYGANQGLLASPAQRPYRTAALLQFAPSEFSRVRLQVARDRAREGKNDTQVFVQYQASLGAHGAHGY